MKTFLFTIYVLALLSTSVLHSTKTSSQKDSNTHDKLLTYVTHLEKMTTAPTADEINEGITLVVRYKNFFCAKSTKIITLPFYLYPNATPLEETQPLYESLKQFINFKEQVLQYRVNILNKTELEDAIEKFFTSTKSLWENNPINEDLIQKTLEYVSYDLDSIEELSQRGNKLQKIILQEHSIKELINHPILQPPQHAYIGDLTKIIAGEIQALEKQKPITLKDAQKFIHGAYNWLIQAYGQAKNAEIQKSVYLGDLGRAAAQEVLLPQKLEKLLTKLCQENKLESLQLIFRGNPHLLTIKNTQKLSLQETFAKNKNLSALKTLQQFIFNSAQQVKTKTWLTKKFTVQLPPELDE